MKEFLKNPIDEHKELNIKIKILNDLLTREDITQLVCNEEYHLLMDQLAVMNAYSSILEHRLNRHNICYINNKYYKELV